MRGGGRVIGVMGAFVALMLATVGGVSTAGARTARCGDWGRPAVAADPQPHTLRVFAIQFRQDPAAMATASDYSRAIDCAIGTEVLPRLARGRPNLVVFDEDVGLETIAIGRRGAGARGLLRTGDPSCRGASLCPVLGTLTELDRGYASALRYLTPRFPALTGELGRSFVAATDTFVHVFMTTMATAARRYGVYVVASNTQARFRVDRSPGAISALADPGAPRPRFVYAPSTAVAYDQTFVWSPKVLHRHDPPPTANLMAENLKLPLTNFEQDLGFAPGPSTGAAAVANLWPVSIPGTGARLGLATSLPAFTYGSARTTHPCADVALTYMRCLNRLGANIVVQADANDGEWTGSGGSESWQPLAWMGSAYRAVSDPSVRFAYAVNSFMVGNLADIPFDGQSAILQRGRRGRGCHYVGDGRFLPRQDTASFRFYAGLKSDFLALAPWVVPDGPRAGLRRVGAALAADRRAYVQTAVIADLPFPADHRRSGCLVSGR